MENREKSEIPQETRTEFRNEIRSLLLVYAALLVLPLLTGFACQG